MAATLDSTTAERFAKLALACVEREYPGKIAHTLNSDEDVKPPRELTPSFYGCYDWHSSVHAHWLLARLSRLFPQAEFTASAKAALGRNLTESKLRREAEYLAGAGRASFERPYGLAWLMQLSSELQAWDDPEAKKWLAAIAPLDAIAVRRVKDWLAKLRNPVRSGEHSQSAFSLGLMLDYARASRDNEFAALIEIKARAFYLGDRACPLTYEPSGEDFLSPCLGEADLMRRVLAPAEFATWLQVFMPNVPLTPAVSPDPSDGKLAHLDGLNLSRAWMLEAIARALPQGHPQRAALLANADAHARAGLEAVTGEHYEGGHWLGTFAVFLLSSRP